MSDTKKQLPDPLVRQRIFPNAAEIFSFAPKSLQEAIQNGIIVIDTNVLLVPYTTGKSSLEQIKITYERLAGENRLRIPGQVAREFAENRAEKLKTLYQQLTRKRNIDPPRSEYPLLEGLPKYTEITVLEEEIAEKAKKYRKAIGELLDTVASWNWDDPVSSIYRNIIKSNSIVDPKFDREELLKDLKYRHENKIPPGYKDSANEHSGIGDLLIWKTIIEIGKESSKDVIFVTGDEKTDWRYQSENRALYPRFELLEEFRESSGGRTILIISFAELLQQFGVPAPIVAEVRKEEAIAAALAAPVDSVDPADSAAEAAEAHKTAFIAEQAVMEWAATRYPGCPVNESHSRFFDFIVNTPEGMRGFDVKLISSNPTLLRARIRNWLRMRLRANSPAIATTLVLVSTEPGISAPVVNAFETMLERLDYPNQLHIVAGYIDGGIFIKELEFGIDPGQYENVDPNAL